VSKLIFTIKHRHIYVQIFNRHTKKTQKHLFTLQKTLHKTTIQQLLQNRTSPNNSRQKEHNITSLNDLFIDRKNQSTQNRFLTNPKYNHQNLPNTRKNYASTRNKQTNTNPKHHHPHQTQNTDQSMTLFVANTAQIQSWPATTIPQHKVKY